MTLNVRQQFINAVGLSLASLVLAKDSTDEEWKTAVLNLYGKTYRAKTEIETRKIIDDSSDEDL